MVLSIDIEAAATLVGAKSGLRIKLLAELLVNPSREYTESELAKIGTCTSSAVAKSLRPLASGILKDILKTCFQRNTTAKPNINGVVAHLLRIGNKEIVIKFLNEILGEPKNIADLQKFVVLVKELSKLDGLEDIAENVIAIIFNKIKNTQNHFSSPKNTITNIFTRRKKQEFNDPCNVEKYLQLVSNLLFNIIPSIKRLTSSESEDRDAEIKKWYKKLVKRIL